MSEHERREARQWKWCFGRLAVMVFLMWGMLGLIYIQDDGAAPSFPQLRGVGLINARVGTATPALPVGTVDNDLLIMFCETANQAITVTDWVELSCSPQSTGNTRLTAFSNQWTTGENRTTSDSGNHQMCAIVGIQTGTYDTADEFDGCQGSIQTPATAARAITGLTTTTGFNLIFAAAGSDLPDANDADEYQGEANSNLTALAELMDDAKNVGDGGTLLIIVGELETAGATGTTTSTQEAAAVSGNITIAINPVP